MGIVMVRAPNTIPRTKKAGINVKKKSSDRHTRTKRHLTPQKPHTPSLKRSQVKRKDQGPPTKITGRGKEGVILRSVKKTSLGRKKLGNEKKKKQQT